MRGWNMGFRLSIGVSLLAMSLQAQPERCIVAVSATGGDYLKGAGGTLARLIDEVVTK